jgi:glutamine---fructose-6-phosphate transaminase (isomerizing)
MCGVFGFIAGKTGVCIRTLRKIAFDNQRRGADAWGMAWIDQKGELQMYKETGAISNSLDMLAMAKDATLLIGHTRYATQGTPAINSNNHPHYADGGFIVHNGMIPQYRDIIEEHGLQTTTECDSEVLARLIEQFGSEPVLQRCIQAARIAHTNPLVMLGLWKPGVMVAARRRNPLWIGQSKGGRYLSSIPSSLPGSVKEFQDRKAVTFQAS